MNITKNTKLDTKLINMVGEGTNWEIGIDIYIPWYIKYVTNKNLFHSTGNSPQYSSDFLGKEPEKSGYVYN